MYLNFRLKLNKARKTTRTFRYDLNQIPYDYMVEVTNRFKGLALTDRVPEELWMFWFLAMRHVRSQLPDQGSNLQPLHWKVKS